MELPSTLHGTLKRVDKYTFPVTSKLSKLLKLLMLIPATAGTVERAQFSLKFRSSHQRCSMKKVFLERCLGLPLN